MYIHTLAANSCLETVLEMYNNIKEALQNDVSAALPYCLIILKSNKE